MVETENLLIDALQKMDLNYEEAQIYFTLLKYGKSGTIVRKLREELSYIERTTIYSILRRLIEKGCVHEEKSSDDSKRLKTFIATDPTEYFNSVFSKKKHEFKELHKIKNKLLRNLQNLYIQGLELTNDDLDPFILPYFQSLLNKGWKVLTQKINKGINILGSEIFYEYHISHPKNLEKKIEMLGIMISLYDSNIENDEIAVKFLTNQVKKIIKELHQADFNNIDMKDGEIELFGKKFLSLVIKAKEKKSQRYIEFGTTAIMPIKNKIFFIWEELIHNKDEINKVELENVFKEIVKPIFEVEGISIQKN